MIFVSYMPGGCGKFISALIWSLFENNQVFLSDLGSAHQNFWAFYGINTYIEHFWDELLEIKDNSAPADYIDQYHVYDEEKPGPKIGQLHNTRFDKIINRFPEAKIVFIRHLNDSEIKDASENFFLKYFLEYRPTLRNPSDTLSLENWHKYIKLNPDIFPDPDIVPWNITRDQLTELINRYSKIPYWSNWKNEAVMDDRILTLSYNDIVNGKSEVIENLSMFFGATPNKNHKMILHRYARSQPKLSDWIDWFD